MTSYDLFGSIRALASAGDDRATWEKRIWEQFGCRRAVLVVDSTGFTRVTKSHGVIHYLLLIAKLRDIVADVLQRHHCVQCQFAADNVQAHFIEPIDALEAAIAINTEIHHQDLMVTESEPFTVCVGVGYGDLLDCGPEGLYGSEMNLASKLGEDIAEGREILVTEAVWAALPPAKRSQFEERHYGIADTSVRYYWSHWAA